MTDTKLLDRVRALLTQAEHPNTTEAEAEAFTAKAAALMTKYGIDTAMVADRDTAKAESVTTLRIKVAAPFAREKGSLLSWIACASRCEAVLNKTGRTVETVTLFGFPTDLERVQVLYTSLLLQGTRDAVRAQVPYYENAAAWRRTWWLGFASAVSARLEAAEKRAQATAEGERQVNNSGGSRSVALVLADRSTQVEAAVATAFPRLKKSRKRQLSGGGLHEGYAAGQRADIGNTRVGTGQRSRIGGAR